MRAETRRLSTAHNARTFELKQGNEYRALQLLRILSLSLLQKLLLQLAKWSLFCFLSLLI